jgi:adenine-specific DNA-methyltransferase
LRQWKENRKGTLISKLRELFEQYNKDYDSKVFGEHEGDKHLCDQIDISDNVLDKVISGLYTIEDGSTQYDFSLIDADILGNIYEQYLGHILNKTKLTESKAKRKEEGIYYTPSYVVDYIIRNTVGELVKNKKIDVSKIKILDPACGSGSFLIKAFDVLNGYYSKKEGYNQNKLDMSGTGTTYSTKLSILKDNIFGVDLDRQAVDIAQLNLLLKVAEKKRRLPILQQNIKNGNSLIDDPNLAGDKAFKWNDEFAEIMNEGKFDVVVGNPPYVRIQNLDKKEVEYFNNNYKSPEKNYDIYMLFIEKGYSLLKEGGMLGFILPHKFFESENGVKVRKFIYESKSLYKLVDFNANQVFDNATTYTCLLFLSKKPNKKFYYKEFRLGEDFKNLTNIKFEEKEIELLKEDKWNFSNKNISKILTRIKSGVSFDNITSKIFKGSSTGNDNIFLVDLIKRDAKTSIVFSKSLNQEIELENDLLKPFLYGEDIRRYQQPISKKLLIFPYSVEKEKAQLIPANVLKTKYPKTFDYLNRQKGELLKRKVELSNSEFYKYSAGRSLNEYNNPKIMIPDMLVENRISYDQKGIFYHGPAIHSVVFNEHAKEYDPLFYLAILNSRLFWFFIAKTSTSLRGNTYRLTPEFVSPFCFPKIDLHKSIDKKNYSRLVELAKVMINLNGELALFGNKKTDKTEKLANQINDIDKEIDDITYYLYGITEDEKKVIEESLKVR